MDTRARKWRSRKHARWILSAVAGVVAAWAVFPLFGWAVSALTGWGTVAVVNVTWTLLEIWHMNSETTREHATVEDPGRPVARMVSTLGSLASLAAVVVVATQAQRAEAPTSYVLAGIALCSVASSWAMIQVDYLLRYASEYYRSADGNTLARGIDFNQPEDPEYTDFAYFSVGLGMTYQVSDTNVTRNVIRRLVIAQTVLGYLFGAGILATVVNLITGLS